MTIEEIIARDEANAKLHREEFRARIALRMIGVSAEQKEKNAANVEKVLRREEREDRF